MDTILLVVCRVNGGFLDHCTGPNWCGSSKLDYLARARCEIAACASKQDPMSD